MATVVPGPSVAGSVLAGSVLAGPLVAGRLVRGALVVDGGGGGAGVLLVTGALVGGEGVERGGLGRLLDPLGDAGPGAVLDDGGDGDTPGLPLDEDGPDGPAGPEDGGVLVAGVLGPEGGGGGVVVGPLGPPEPLGPPLATVSITYPPNGSSVPAGGSVAVTFASPAGALGPAYPAARPASVSSRPAWAKLRPARSGTVRRLLASKAVSFPPVVPTGRLMPRAGSWTSTRATRCSFRGAGFTATTDFRSYPAHFLLPSSNRTEIRPVSPSKGRSGFPHEHFTAGSPCSSTRIAIPAWSKELYGTAFSFL